MVHVTSLAYLGLGHYPQKCGVLFGSADNAAALCHTEHCFLGHREHHKSSNPREIG